MFRRLWTRIAAICALLALTIVGLLGLLLADNLEDWLWLLLVVALGGLGAAMLLTRLTRSIEVQIAQIRNALSRFGHGDLDVRARVLGSDELAEVAVDFNDMAHLISSEMRAGTLERSQMAAVFEQMHDGIILTDRDGRVGSINLAAARLFSTTPDDAVGRSLIEVTRDYELHNALRSVLSGPNHHQSIEVRAGQHTISTLVTAVPDPGGGPANGLVVLQDVTELRQLERIRRDFVANIGHEFRTPLASIKLLAETLHTAVDDDPEKAREFLKRIDVEVDGLTELVRELLELSRIEAGQINRIREPVDIGGLLEHAAARLRPHAERAGLQLTVRCQNNLPLAWADPARIEAVLVNLLHNAIKFTPPGGSVLLQATRHPSPDTREAELLVSVADTGVGILPEDLPRIFERFYKGDAARTRPVPRPPSPGTHPPTSNTREADTREAGTGLGLAIAKHTVQAHGGRIWVESDYGHGTTFFFTLPITTC
jgi:two-component system phosphate regulon sensor histidine kinase PhoR